ncbi:hypothetical protein LWI29_006485 [Acer saccharum]|uniref:Serine carboxypeptidase-like 18 n=1 Tax=Acer saccharum TaxID=4024 RepID=A0AA39W5W3_ACESA|nr:hypothetical protein LWI29_006485 [Acer saccharum]
MAAPSHEQNLSIINYSKWVCLQMVYLLILSRLVASFSTVRYLPGFSGSLSFKLETGKEVTFSQTGFQGYVLGNPETDPKYDVNSEVPYAHRMALISDELYKSARRNCNGEYVEVGNRNVQCAKDLQAISECTNGLNRQHILEPLCPSNDNDINKMNAGYHRSVLEKYNEPLVSMANISKFGCRNYKDFLLKIWENDINVHKALHVRKSAKRNCRGEYVQVDHRNVQCAKDLQAISKCTNRLNHQHILKPFCPSMYNHINKMDANIYHRSMLEKYNEPLLSKANRTKFECMHFDTNIMDAWGNDINVHKALHVRKVASIIFLDAPVGTGFSYSRCLQGSKSSDIKYANHSYEFLRKWLLSHPKFIGNPFYVAGDSYSGMIVPVIAHEISADDYIRISNSSGDDDEDDNVDGSACEPQKLTRAQRKRLRKKKLKEDASRRSKIIGPLLPTPNNDDDGGGENVSPSVRQNADEECAVTSDMPREIIGCSDQKKLKNRRKAKKLTRDRLKCSSSKENCSEDQKLKSPNETCDQAHHSCSQD